MGYATFVDGGKLIHAVPKKTSGAIPYMQGTNLPLMLFCGFVNWVGHLMSDLVGASSTRQPGKTGRGAGIPIPFYELFLFCDFGDIDGKTFAETIVKVFEEGYDARFGAAMAIPVLLEELMIRTIWTIRQKFVRKKSWSESLPSKRHADLRIMLIVGNGTLCAIDGADAAVRGFASGNVVTFICRLNLIGWARLVTLVLQELRIRLGPVIAKKIDEAINYILETLTPAERAEIEAFYKRLSDYDAELNKQFEEFVARVEEEYKLLYFAIDATFNDDLCTAVQAENSARLARVAGVKTEKILKSNDDLDKLFTGGE